MSNSARTLLVAVILLAVFVLGALATQLWLKRQTATVLSAARTPPTATAAGAPAVTEDAVARLQRMHQRALLALVVLAVVLSAVPWVLLVLSHRRSTPDTAAPWRREAAGLERIARLSAERGEALEQEQGARLRAEEDLQLSRSLLDHSLEERVRLGRELHDNICQTLYAVTLTLESVRRTVAAPSVPAQRLDQCMTELRRLNQQVRTYLRDLEPATVQSEPLTVALRGLLATTSAGAVLNVEERLDEEALRLVPARHAADVVSIVREAISNSIRHGHARHLSIRAAHDGGEVALAIADDGIGFTPPPADSGGRGLGNMQARAAALGGRLQIESHTGRGTRVILSIPVGSAPA